MRAIANEGLSGEQSWKIIAAVDNVRHVVEIRSPLNMKRLEGHLRQKRYIRMPEFYNVKILENVLHFQLLNGCS